MIINTGRFLLYKKIPEKNQKNFRYCIDTGKNFWYHINTGKKCKKIPVFIKEGENDEK